MDEKKFESFKWSEQQESNNEGIKTHRWRKILTMLAIATTLATTSCDSIPSREERVANRIERQEARSAQRAEISANKMAHTVFQLNAHIDTYEDLVDKYNELVSRVEPGKKNSVLENNIRQLRHQIKDCENEINRLSTKYFKESYTASINQGWSTTLATYDKWKYNGLRDLINK